MATSVITTFAVWAYPGSRGANSGGKSLESYQPTSITHTDCREPRRGGEEERRRGQLSKGFSVRSTARSDAAHHVDPGSAGGWKSPRCSSRWQRSERAMPGTLLSHGVGPHRAGPGPSRLF